MRDLRPGISLPSVLLVDIGGVLTRDQWKVAATILERETGISFAKVLRVLRERSSALDLGNITVADFCRKVSDLGHLKVSPKRFRAVVLDESLELVDANYQALKSLKRDHGTRIVAVTNVGREIADSLERKFHLSRVVDSFVRSCDAKLLKPDERIFHLALERAGCAASDCLFVDDSEENVKVARGIGIPSVTLDEPTKFASLLKSRF